MSRWEPGSGTPVSLSPSNTFRMLVARGRQASMRLSWTVVDQGLSAITNLLLSLLVARSTSAGGFGAFAVAFLVYGLVIGLSRALVGQPLQIAFASADRDAFRTAAARALGAAAILGAVAALLTIVGGLVIGGQTGAALIALAPWYPALVLQDTYRMAFFTEGTPKKAATIDLAWAVVVLGGFGIALAAGVAHQAAVPLSLWGLGAAIAAVLGAALLRVGVHVRGSVRWMRDRRNLSGYLGAEYLLTMGIAQAGILMVGFVSQAGVGAIRAGQVLMGPTNVIGSAAMVFTTTEVARRPDASARHRWLFAALVSGLLASAIALYVTVLLLVPDTVGTHLLGDTWSGAASVLVPLCVVGVAASLGAGPVATLYGMGLARATLHINVLRAALNVVFLSVGVSHWGALGAAWALAITELILIPVWCVRLRIALARGEGTASPALDVAEPVIEPRRQDLSLALTEERL